LVNLGWSKSVVETLSEDLQKEFPEAYRNLLPSPEEIAEKLTGFM